MAADRPVECTDSTGLPVADVVATGLGLGMLTLIAVSPDGPRSPGAGIVVAGAAVASIGLGVVGGASAMYGFRKVRDCRRAKREERARNEELAAAMARDVQRKQLRAAAWQHTKAAAAARAGDCTTVAQLEPRVRAIDAEFRATVFARDAAIARRLGR